MQNEERGDAPDSPAICSVLAPGEPNRRKGRSEHTEREEVDRFIIYGRH